MRASRTSGSRSGTWKRSRAALVRHRQTKGPDTDRRHLNHRATSRLYTIAVTKIGFFVLDRGFEEARFDQNKPVW